MAPLARPAVPAVPAQLTLPAHHHGCVCTGLVQYGAEWCGAMQLIRVRSWGQPSHAACGQLDTRLLWMVWVPQEVAAPASKVSHVVNSSGIVGRERMLRVVMVHL